MLTFLPRGQVQRLVGTEAIYANHDVRGGEHEPGVSALKRRRYNDLLSARGLDYVFISQFLVHLAEGIGCIQCLNWRSVRQRARGWVLHMVRRRQRFWFHESREILSRYIGVTQREVMVGSGRLKSKPSWSLVVMSFIPR
jgi:hypothetical protein